LKRKCQVSFVSIRKSLVLTLLMWRNVSTGDDISFQISIQKGTNISVQLEMVALLMKFMMLLLYGKSDYRFSDSVDNMAGNARKLMKTNMETADESLKVFIGFEFFPIDDTKFDVRNWVISIIVESLESVREERSANLVLKSLLKHCYVNNLFKADVTDCTLRVQRDDADQLRNIIINGPGGGYVIEYYYGQ